MTIVCFCKKEHCTDCMLQKLAREIDVLKATAAWWEKKAKEANYLPEEDYDLTKEVA